MNINNFSIDELYVFFHNMEDRGVNSFDIFLIGTDKLFTVKNFLEVLYKNDFCSSFFMRKFFESFPDKNDIYFGENLIKKIMEFESYNYEDAKDCFIYMMCRFLEMNKSNIFSIVFLDNIRIYMKNLKLDIARNIYEETADVSPIFYTAYNDVQNVPVFVKNYVLSVEREDEENILQETTKGVALNSCKKEDIEELLESLIDISDGLENTLALKLKKTLGL